MGREGVGLRWWQRLTRRYLAFCQELLVQKESIVAAIGEGFGKWARICYRYPYHVMLASLVLCVAMASGLLPPTPVWIDGAEKLYSLPYSRARDDGTLHTSYFGDVLGRKSVVILKHKVEGSNILTWKYLEAIQHLDAIIRGREVDPVGSRKLVIPRTFGDQNDNIFSQSEGKQETEKAVQESNRSAGHASDDALNSGTLSNNSRHPRGSHSSTGMDDRGYMTFEDICLMNPFGECAIDSVLKFGLHELRQMGFLPGEPEVWVFDGTVYNTKQVGFIPEYFLGGITKEQCWRQMPLELAQRLLPSSRIRPLPDQPGFAMVDIDCITKAQAAMLQYDADGRSQFEGRNMMWERLFIQIMKDNQSFGDLEVSFQAFRSRDDELRASTSESKDVVYVVFTFFILATYSTALNFSCDLYRNKLFSALMGFGAAFMGLGAGMGIVAYMGMPMVPTVLICPFLVLGIGVDDMFVVMNCYCVSYTIHDPEERCIQALRISGLGISITTLTNLISFGVGAFSAYMSIRNFCVYSAMALFMGYVFVLTFFFPTLCIDARREECARVCPFCLPDISDRQKVAQERLAEMTDEERKIVESMASLSQEELIAYKVNVFYEEQAIRKATRRIPREGKDDAIMIAVPKLATTIGGLPPDLAREALYEEPRGNVGRKWREFFLCYYGPLLMWFPVKVAVVVAFVAIAAVSVYGFTKLELGLELSELAPGNSYMRRFDADFAHYFNKFDQPTDIFFVDRGNSVDDMSIRTEWWNPKVQAALRAFHKKLESRPTTSRLVNPLLTMLDDPQIGAKLRMGDKQVFEDTIYYQLVHSKSPYRQFKFDFIWTGRELKTWRMRLLPKYMATSEERASWMQQLRNDCDEAAKAFVEISEGDNNEEVEYASSNEKSSSVSLTDKASSAWGTTRDDLRALPSEPIYPIAYTYMMIFYESDLGILSSVLINMLSAGLAMLLVAFVLIPEALAGFLVILMICLIDLALFGFMYFWRVKLHMVSTIALVISIGFAVDYSAHLCHTFTHCKGETREKRVIESLVLMGNPIFHGASSTLLGIMLLGFSESFVFTVFFRMMVMVVAFGASHGMLLLPVILSWIGPMGHTDHGKALESSTSCADLSGEGTVSRPEKPHQLHSKLPKDQFTPSVPFPQHLSHPAEENTSKTNPTLLTSKLRPEASRSGGAPNVLGAAEAEKNAENSHVGRWFLAKMLPKASSGGDRQQIGSETFGSLQGTDEGASFVIDTTGHRRPVVHPRAASLPVPLPVRSLPASLDVQSFRQTHANPHNLADHCFLPYSDQKVRVSADDTAAALRPSGPWAHGDEEPTSSCISSPLDYTAHQQASQLKAHRRSRLLEGQIPNSVENSEANRGTLHGVSSTTASGLPSHPLETASAELELAPMIASSQAAAALSQLREKLWNSVASSRTSTGSGVFLQNKEIYPMASQRCTQRKRSSHESRIGEMKGCCEETQGGEDGREMREPKVCVPLVKEPPFPSVASEVSSAAFSENTTGATNNPDLKKHIVAHPRRVMSCGPTLSLQPSLKSSSVVSSQHPSLVSGNASSISHSKRRNSAVAGKPSFSTAYHSGTATIGGQPVITVRKGIGVVGFPHPGCTSIAGARSGQRRHSTSKGASSGQNLPSLVSNRLPRPPKSGTPHDTQNSRSSDVVGHGFPAAAEELDTGGRRTANSEVGSGAKRSHSTNSVNLGRTPREREPHTRPGSHTFGLVHSSSLPSNVARDGECKHTPLPPASRSSSAVSTTFANTSTHNARPKSQNSPVSYVSSHASKKLILPPTHLATSHQRGRSSQNHSQPTHVMGKADQDKGQALESVSSLDAPAGSASKRRNSTGNLMANRGRRELGVVSASGHSETEQKRGESRQQRSGRRDTRDPNGQGMEAGDERTEDEISKPGCGKEEDQTKGGGLFQQLLHRGMSLRKTRDEGPLA
ncbi:patched family protein [Toxoplasma gondii ME49]|uniref:Patched family protein n=2 Tax=Toxoplasma gondii TaxID=5811 RepID=S8F5K2_TOXGM|nr:patched family protein [Toxoplasma gondii ME49]EPT31101.1 patched family protein [Toxoplasma gondii ME49]KYF43896.1 patched family protein [Toxoplasma gondii ARI]|eukprot:XP_002369195.1 patched family protein [Toxoplasma gondii ME49]